MASRMEKYYKEDTYSKRSTRNRDLYDSIYRDTDYADINITPQSRTINIEELREMIGEKKPEREEKKVIEPINFEETKSYDLKEMMDKARETKVDDDKKRSLSNTQYNILKNLTIKKENDMDSLVDTIATKSLINEDKDLFDDLKSMDNTTVGVPSDLNEIFKQDFDATRNMDETFFTKSMKLDPQDFETINSGLEKNNKMMKIIFILIIIVIVIVLGIIICMVI